MRISSHVTPGRVAKVALAYPQIVALFNLVEDKLVVERRQRERETLLIAKYFLSDAMINLEAVGDDMELDDE